MQLIPAAVLILSSVITSSFIHPISCHDYEAFLDNELDVGPMERPGFFEEAYNGKEQGYSAVGEVWTAKPPPVPKLRMLRVYAPKKANTRGLAADGSKRRPFFDLIPGNLPLDLLQRPRLFNFGIGGNFGANFQLGNRPAWGVNTGFNYGREGYGGFGQGPVPGPQGPPPGPVQPSGGVTDRVRANGW
jgi:hypothetical protein